ncbi:MAG: MBL fold metallo-hydrolase, partial [Oscillospiraceae bacterium]|nr:MBL fold metallo-hydrolase [Oscillospiraceae bacterium]
MKITFLGAAHEVTGSCTLLEAGGRYILVDCGMEQGRDTFVMQQLPVEAARIDCVLLTHAHIDHSGKLPLLYKEGFKGTVYATEATYHLCEIMLMDCAHILESEAERETRKGRRSGGGSAEPLYSLEDARGVLGRFRPCGYGEEIRVFDDTYVRFLDAGHLLGSACIEVWLGEGGRQRKLVFSGDLGNPDKPIIQDPQTAAEADYVILESTYGNRLHKERPGVAADLEAFVERTLERGGNVVMPSFAIGRAQEMLYLFRQINDERQAAGRFVFPVYLDSPLAGEATSIFLQCDPSYFDSEMRELLHRGVNPLMFKSLRVAAGIGESRAINDDPQPKVIISASGMCEAGRV